MYHCVSCWQMCRPIGQLHPFTVKSASTYVRGRYEGFDATHDLACEDGKNECLKDRM